MALGIPPVIKRLHVLRRVGKPDVLFGVLTRVGDTDHLCVWFGDPPDWVHVLDLPGTDLIYDTVTWQERVHLADGKNPILRFDENLDCFDEAPVVQYLTVFQDRLVGAGDARLIPSEVAEVDSNRDRVLFCEVIEFTTWSPNNFINANTGTGEQISGLGVNSITSSDRGAQGQLVVFKPSSTLINDGVLGSGDQRLNVVSAVIGAPGYNSIKNTPWGLMFASKHGVYRMDTSGKEPSPVGIFIHPELDNVSTDVQKWHAAIFHNDTYKLSIAGKEDDANTREWWLDLRQGIFPDRNNWYGPHIGDLIFQYEIFNGELIGAEWGTDRIWKLDVEGSWRTMTTTDPRVTVMTWPRLAAENMTRGKLDAYGFKGVTDSDAPVELFESVDFERGVTATEQVFTIPAQPAVYNVTRPIKRNSYDAQITIEEQSACDIEVHTLYVRGKTTRRQSEKMDGSTQSEE